jgi:hypothetical protein
MVERPDLLRRQIDEGDALLTMCSGGGIFSQEAEGTSEHPVGFEAVHRCGYALGQPVELFSQLSRGR